MKAHLNHILREVGTLPVNMPIVPHVVQTML
jgi:hypothetical protein